MNGSLPSIAVVHLSISGLVNRILLILVVLILQMIASIILGIIRKKKHRKRNDVVALTAYMILGSLVLGDFAVWKATMTLAVYAAYMAASFILLWKGR